MRVLSNKWTDFYVTKQNADFNGWWGLLRQKWEYNSIIRKSYGEIFKRARETSKFAKCVKTSRHHFVEEGRERPKLLMYKEKVTIIKLLPGQDVAGEYGGRNWQKLGLGKQVRMYIYSQCRVPTVLHNCLKLHPLRALFVSTENNGTELVIIRFAAISSLPHQSMCCVLVPLHTIHLDDHFYPRLSSCPLESPIMWAILKFHHFRLFLLLLLCSSIWEHFPRQRVWLVAGTRTRTKENGVLLLFVVRKYSTEVNWFKCFPFLHYKVEECRRRAATAFIAIPGRRNLLSGEKQLNCR